jgi:hypothetical protein
MWVRSIKPKRERDPKKTQTRKKEDNLVKNKMENLKS